MRKPVIENNIPIPPRMGTASSCKYAWLNEVEVGQSFLTDKKAITSLDQSYRSMVARGFLPSGYKLSRRTLEGGNIRVWRIA